MYGCLPKIFMNIKISFLIVLILKKLFFKQIYKHFFTNCTVSRVTTYINIKYIHDCKNVTFKFLVINLIGKSSPLTAHTILSNYYYNNFIV